MPAPGQGRQPQASVPNDKNGAAPLRGRPVAQDAAVAVGGELRLMALLAVNITAELSALLCYPVGLAAIAVGL